MSILGFLTNNNPQQVTIARDVPGNKPPGLTLDAAVRMVPSREVNVTSNPVESGGKISDHATLGNISFLLDGLISEAPLPSGLLGQALGILAGAAGGLIGTQAGGGLAGTAFTAVAAGLATQVANFALSPDIPSGSSLEFQMGNRIPGDTEFPAKAYKFLFGLQQDRELLAINSRIVNLSQMLITSISAPFTIDNGRSLMFTARFEQLQIVKSATASLAENVVSAAATGAASKSNLGQQAASAATEKQTSNASESMLSSFFN